ncbi:MAG: thioredoxin-like domain-containing protein, partial [Legionellales bacterium]
PCAGPILASVIVQTVMQKTNLFSFFTLLAFSLGAGLPMLIIALYGTILLNRFNFLKTKTTQLRKLMGAILILSVGSMVYFENVFAGPTTTQTEIKTTTALSNGLWFPYPAPQIEGIEDWINSPPLKMAELKGKVVLIDFWTYSCINCLRTLPYLNDWYQHYHNKGLVIIGIHAPEFDFEKNLSNVINAVQRDKILYPVALDNQFKTWSNYNNHYWPAHFLINKKGEVVYKHFGEGEYGITENNIRYLLDIKDLTQASSKSEDTASFNQTPETYLGSERADLNLSPSLVQNKTAEYTFPSQLALNAWGLDGFWQVNSDSIKSAKAKAALKIHFNACKVYAVMGNDTSMPIEVDLLFNGEKLITDKGKDVKNSSLLV